MSDFTYRHPWRAASVVGLAIFVTILMLGITMIEVSTPAAYAALLAGLFAVTLGIVWRGGLED